MAGIFVDFKNAAAVTPGDGCPRELARILDKGDNLYCNDLYLYATPSNTRVQVGPFFNTSTVSATGSTTQKQGVLLLAGTTPTVTIPTPTAGTDDGKQLLLVNTTAGTKTVTAGANHIFDTGTATTSPVVRTNITLTGVGAQALLTAIQGNWYVLSQTLDLDNTDTIYIGYS